MKKSERITLFIIISVFLLAFLGYYGFEHFLMEGIYLEKVRSVEKTWELDYLAVHTKCIDFVNESYYNSLYITEDLRYTYELNEETIKVNIIGNESFEKIIDGKINQIEDVSRIIYYDNYYYTISNINSINKLVKFNKDKIEYKDLSISGYAYLFYDYTPYILSTNENSTSVFDFSENFIGSVDTKYESILSLYIDNDTVLLNNDYSKGYRNEKGKEYSAFRFYNDLYAFGCKDGYNRHTFRKCNSFKYIIGKNHFIEFSNIEKNLVILDFEIEDKGAKPKTFYMTGYHLADYNIKSNVLMVTLSNDTDFKTVYISL